MTSLWTSDLTTDLRQGVHIDHMSSLFLQIVFQTTIGHEWEDDEWHSIRCVKTHSSQTKNVGMFKVLHQQTFSKECFKLIFRAKVYQRE